MYRPRELLGYQNQREQEKEKARCRYRAFNSSKTSLVSWRERGKEVLEIVATEQPDRFLQIAASLVPKGIELAVEQNRGQLTPALYALFDACLWSTPNAREIEPSVAGHRWSAPTRLMSSTMPRSERPALRSQMYDYAAGGATQVKLLILPNGIGTLADVTLI